MSLPAAVLWDMDGTLVDTEPYWIAAEHAIVAEHGGTWSDEFAHQLVGNDLMVSAAFIRDHCADRPGRPSGSSTSCSPGWSRRCVSTCPGDPVRASCSTPCAPRACRARS